jgi:hypothetical protein
MAITPPCRTNRNLFFHRISEHSLGIALRIAPAGPDTWYCKAVTLIAYSDVANLTPFSDFLRSVQ